jgi:hypothetical protein
VRVLKDIFAASRLSTMRVVVSYFALELPTYLLILKSFKSWRTYCVKVNSVPLPVLLSSLKLLTSLLYSRLYACFGIALLWNRLAYNLSGFGTGLLILRVCL